MADNINHPSHYEKTCSLECIDVMRLILGKEGMANYCMGNAFKYVWRYKNKNGMEDLKKAKWYLDYVNDNVFVGLNTWENRVYDDLVFLVNEKLKEVPD